MISLAERDSSSGRAIAPIWVETLIGRRTQPELQSFLSPRKMRGMESVRGVPWTVKHLGAFLATRLAR